jgi:iron complex outermembrane recepter protein
MQMQRPAKKSGYHDRLTVVFCWTLVLPLLATTPFLSATETAAVTVRISDDPSAELVPEDRSQLPGWFLPDDGLTIDEASFQEQPLRTVPRVAPAPTRLPTAADELTTDLFGSGLGVRRSVLPEDRWTQAVGIGGDLIRMQEAVVRSTTDTGSLLGESPSAVGLGLQRRNPIVNDPRIRGSRIGRLPASGSYWVPARMDLDTMVSKIDSRLVQDVLTINGPYAVRYGPGFSFVDLALLPTPRFDDGFQLEGMTGFDFKANGEQFYGRQMFSGGAGDWGFRAGYGHRTGNDYTMGNGQSIASSYNSRDVDLALGHDFGADQRVEFHVLRLDQTGVELPGQAFDIEWLGTDAYEVTYTVDCPSFADRVAVDVWYNRTRLDGNAQRPGKRLQFPYYEIIDFEGFTDVESMSTGFRWAATWGCPDCEHLTVGLDLRYIKQELNEITSGQSDSTSGKTPTRRSPVPPRSTPGSSWSTARVGRAVDDCRRSAGRLGGPGHLGRSGGTRIPGHAVASAG